MSALMTRSSSSVATCLLAATCLSRRPPFRRRVSGVTLLDSKKQAPQEFVAGLAFDLETTGLDVGKAEIVQFAVVIANSAKGSRFSRLVMPEGAIDPGAAAVHGFTRKTLEARGARPFAECWADCERWLHETLASDTRPLVWAAHNGEKFDQPILNRCILEATGAPSALLSGPRATHVDTLLLARKDLPQRARMPRGSKPYTLGSLYESASPSQSNLDNAHDALADAEALALVWRWLVEDKGVDASSTRWAATLTSGAQPADASVALTPFQAHLQYHGYQMSEQYGDSESSPLGAGKSQAGASRRRDAGPRSRDDSAARERAVQQAAGKAASRAIRGGGTVGPSDGDGEITRVPGIGPGLASLLSSKGITSYDELKALWWQRGADHKRMLGWLGHALPGTSKIALAKATKGMATEFGRTPPPARRD